MISEEFNSQEEFNSHDTCVCVCVFVFVCVCILMYVYIGASFSRD
jgi:hypothetical protein